MLNYLWGFMIIIGTIFAAFTGNLPSVTEATLDSAKEAVMLCITMIGVMSFWVGLMKIAERAGLIEGASKKLEDERRKSPVLGKRGVPKGIANTEMCTFLIVNISSLQLIPINIIAYRTQYGSTNPTRIVGAAILATTVSTAVGVIFAWVMERVKKV